MGKKPLFWGVDYLLGKETPLGIPKTSAFGGDLTSLLSTSHAVTCHPHLRKRLLKHTALTSCFRTLWGLPIVLAVIDMLYEVCSL
jgi:hypothetical protein